jgi:hypothetical protein
MRAEAQTWIRRAAAPSVIAPALLAAALSAGCRTGSVGGTVDPDPALEARSPRYPTVLGRRLSPSDACCATAPR